jgi:hypothetical protein
MMLICPQCGKTLEIAGERPSFCWHCGHALKSAEPVPPADLQHEAITLAPAAAAPSSVETVLQTIGGYRLLRPLGRGGMGAVYEAEHISTGRRVALKLISSDFTRSADTVERFRREGRLASMIAHPHCVFVLAADEEAGQPFIVTELMSGRTLQDLVQEKGPLPPDEAVGKILAVIDGLQEAHAIGIIHRDLKPSNCFLEAGDELVKVGDFGLAKPLAGGQHLTGTGAFLGTLAYASPEQIRGLRLDERTDVYSVAATLYFLLTGRAPHQSGDAAATLARIVSDPAPSIRDLRQEIPPGLDAAALRGLERDRERRWQRLEAFREALLPFAPGQVTSGGKAMRSGAYLLDVLLLLPLPWSARFMLDVLGLATADTLSEARLALVSASCLFVLYFAVLDGLWGCSLGKRLLRLRVWKADTIAVPGFARSLLRTVIFYTFCYLTTDVLQFGTTTEPRSTDMLEPVWIGFSRRKGRGGRGYCSQAESLDLAISHGGGQSKREPPRDHSSDTPTLAAWWSAGRPDLGCLSRAGRMAVA